MGTFGLISPGYGHGRVMSRTAGGRSDDFGLWASAAPDLRVLPRPYVGIKPLRGEYFGQNERAYGWMERCGVGGSGWGDHFARVHQVVGI
jgi:hypothetical protein